MSTSTKLETTGTTETPIFHSHPKPDDIFKLYQNPSTTGNKLPQPETNNVNFVGNILTSTTKKSISPTKIWNYSDGSTSDIVSGSSINERAPPVLPSPEALSSEFSSVLNRIQGILATAQNDNKINVSGHRGDCKLDC